MIIINSNGPRGNLRYSQITCIVSFKLVDHLIIIFFDRFNVFPCTKNCLFKVIVSLYNTILKLKPFRVSMIYKHLSESMEYLLSLHFFTQLNLFEISEVIIDMFIFVTNLSCFCQIICLHLLQWFT